MICLNCEKEAEPGKAQCAECFANTKQHYEKVTDEWEARNVIPAVELEYASFWRRISAALIDGCIIISIATLFALPYLSRSLVKVSELSDILSNWNFLILWRVLVPTGFLTAILYYSVFEFSNLSATPGKLIMRLKIVDIAGQRPQYQQLVSRSIGRIKILFPNLLGLLIANFAFFIVVFIFYVSIALSLYFLIVEMSNIFTSKSGEASYDTSSETRVVVTKGYCANSRKIHVDDY